MHRGLQLLLVLLGYMSLVMLYRWDVSQKNKAEMIHQIQEQRKQLLRERCGNDTEGKDSLHDLSNKMLGNLLVDEYHGVIYCFIPKVACSNWKRVMLVLKWSHSEPYRDPVSIPRQAVHSAPRLLRSFPKPEIKAMLKHYTKFMFVRDPFVRLISAYRNKIGRINQGFYGYARLMMQRYGNVPNPPKRSEEAFAKGMLPSFHNFVQYLLDPRTRKKSFNNHWRQMHLQCHPCMIEYDFIGHLETSSEDSEQLLKSLMLQDVIKMPPSYNNVTTSDSVANWFKTVPLEERRELYKLYEKDFTLFGYRRPDELLDG